MTVEWFYVYRFHITNSGIFLIEHSVELSVGGPTYSKVYTLTPKIFIFFKTSHR